MIPQKKLLPIHGHKSMNPKKELKKWMKYEQMDRIFLGKYWNYHPLKIEKVFFLKKLKISSK